MDEAGSWAVEAREGDDAAVFGADAELSLPLAGAAPARFYLPRRSCTDEFQHALSARVLPPADIADLPW
jgi:hypothetical protein